MLTAKRAISVSELTTNIKKLLKSSFSSVCIHGEMSNITFYRNKGHLYFDLKDATAKISAVSFNAGSKTLTKEPAEGDSVIVSGYIDLYMPHGKYQLIVTSIQFAGIGDLLLQLEATKKKLLLEGLFNADMKQALPIFPLSIGVITSPTGAVIQDIINVLSRRNYNFTLILNPVKVQGIGAAEEISKAISQFNEHKLVDVIIVGRGGGSIEDLWAFNEEVVARAIFNSLIPIISAVGHETDYSISDMVADVRAPTPSAAAEIVIKESEFWIKRIHVLMDRSIEVVEQKIKIAKTRLSAIKRNLYSENMFIDKKMSLDILRKELLLSTRRLLNNKKTSIKSMLPRTNISHIILKHKVSLKNYRKDIINLFNNFYTKNNNSLLYLKQRLNTSQNTAFTHKKTQWNGIRKTMFSSLLSLKNTTINSNRELLSQINKSLLMIDHRNILNRGFAIVLNNNDRKLISSNDSLNKHSSAILVMHDGESLVSIK